MSVIEVIKNKDLLLKQNMIVDCNCCNQKYYSIFERLYILAKGKCYFCESDDLLAENILKNI